MSVGLEDNTTKNIGQAQKGKAKTMNTAPVTTLAELPVPDFFEDSKKRASELRQIDYGMLADQAQAWRQKYQITAAAADQVNFIVTIIDGQITFCLPTGELFVAGRSGTGAVDDMVRLAEFIYRNLHRITRIHATLDTHMPYQIFHPDFWIDEQGNHPAPATQITVEDVQNGKWQVNPAITRYVEGNGNTIELQRHGRHYVNELRKAGRYDLTIWPYHAMLGGVGHALMPIIEEVIFFHAQARQCQPAFHIKGGNPLTENYSVYRSEVMTDRTGAPIAQKNSEFINALLVADIIAAGGEAGSHCFAWSMDDLLVDINQQDPALAGKFHVLEDCISPVVIPAAGLDFTDEQEAALQRFAAAGMQVVKSTTNIGQWASNPFTN